MLYLYGLSQRARIGERVESFVVFLEHRCRDRALGSYVFSLAV